MSRIESRIPSSGEAFIRNMAAFGALREQIDAVREAAVLGGGKEAQARQRARGKLASRQRISLLLDPGTPFMEIGQLAAHDVYDHAVPCAGIVTGIGIVEGHAVAIFANDASVKGSTYYPLTLRKHLRTQQIAREQGLPCLYLVDSGGVYLPLQEEIFPDEHHFGKIFRNIAEMSAMCGRSIGPQLMAMWPNAKTSVVGGEQAATVLALIRAEQAAKQGTSFTPEEEEAFKRPIRESYERQGKRSTSPRECGWTPLSTLPGPASGSP